MNPFSVALSLTSFDISRLHTYVHVPKGIVMDPIQYPDRTSTYGVSTFGHGAHACPGKSFSMLVLKLITGRYLTELELAPYGACACLRVGQVWCARSAIRSDVYVG
jgi:hypothetical protein